MKALEFRNQIYRFLDDEISIHELEEWMVSNLRSLLKEDPNLVAIVELALAEYSDGIRDIDGIKRYLRFSLQEFNTTFIPNPQKEEEFKSSNTSSYQNTAQYWKTSQAHAQIIEYYKVKT